jgi:hypothetical protein
MTGPGAEAENSKGLDGRAPITEAAVTRGRRRLAGTGEKRAGSGRAAPRTRPDPGAVGEGDAPNPMQNSAIKIRAETRKRVTAISMGSALFDKGAFGGNAPDNIFGGQRPTGALASEMPSALAMVQTVV